MSSEEARQACADAWRRYGETGSIEARNDLIVCYTNLVRFVASREAVRLPPGVNVEHLVSDGILGLIDAIKRFDPDRGVKFETYAIPRIRGAIGDSLRRQDPAPRSVRAKAKDLNRARSELEVELGRAPEQAELAKHLGLSVQELWTLQSDAAVAVLVSLEEHDAGDDDRASLSGQLKDVSETPEDQFSVDVEMAQMIGEAVSRMSPRSRAVLALYYLEDRTLAEIGRLLGVTESRVSQLQSRVLDSMRDILANGNSGFVA